jgi:hypothetical protein
MGAYSSHFFGKSFSSRSPPWSSSLFRSLSSSTNPIPIRKLRSVAAAITTQNSFHPDFEILLIREEQKTLCQSQFCEALKATMGLTLVFLFILVLMYVYLNQAQGASPIPPRALVRCDCALQCR